MTYRLLRFVAPTLIAFLSLLVISAGTGAELPPPAAVALKLDQELDQDQEPTPELEPSDVVLCELVLDAASIAEQRAMATAYAYVRRLKEHCALLVRAPEAAQGADAAAPRLSVNGIAMRPVVLDDPQWHRGFQQALADARAAPRWHLDLYLAKTSTRTGSPSIDFSVCNLDQGRRFNGSFRLLLAEQRPVPAQPGYYWRTLRDIVQAPIDDLAPAAVSGCSLPERFELPTRSAGLPLFIIAVVDDAAGNTEAVLTIPLTTNGSQP